MPSIPFALLAVLIPLLMQSVVLLRWMHRRMRDDEIVRAFVRDMALNHLPHIYTILQKMAARQGITLEETPVVRFLDLNGNRHAK
jgi:hypothetical protein